MVDLLLNYLLKQLLATLHVSIATGQSIQPGPSASKVWTVDKTKYVDPLDVNHRTLGTSSSEGWIYIYIYILDVNSQDC